MNQKQTDITTGKQIRHLRTQSGMTQEELAGELNVTRQALSNWERDVNEPDLNTLKKICFLFGVHMKPTLDADGRLIPRVDYRISSLNCGGEDFAVACMRSNLRYGKNQKREDVKSHHYIISFDPRDGPDNGLTVDRAQELGEKFCAEHFPGHQALVCTHPDGHSHTENIHVHIVINSLRIAEVPMLPHMDRPADRKAGCKHRCTDAAMNYLKAEVMEMCHSEGLYQIDLLNGSKERITEREYWAQKKGQAALDRANAPIAADGIAPRQTKFETDKAKLRRTIREALAAASGFDEFAALLLRHDKLCIDTQ